jgi:hypothetical protein
MGVAPEATLLSFKVFTQVDGTDEDTLIEAFLAAHKAEVSLACLPFCSRKSLRLS